MEEPQRVDEKGILYLGCKHIKGRVKLPNGGEATTMTYDMQEFFESCVESYLTLTGLTKDKLREVPTPFLPEDHRESPAGAPVEGEDPMECPWCKHTFPAEQSKKASPAAQSTEVDSACASAAEQPTEETRVKTYVDERGKPPRAKHATRRKLRLSKAQLAGAPLTRMPNLMAERRGDSSQWLPRCS